MRGRSEEARRWQRRSSDRVHADDPRSGDIRARLCPSWRCPFGRLRWVCANELATRIDDCEPKVILSASCGIEPGRVIAYKPLLDEAQEIAAQSRCLFDLAAETAERELISGHDHEWSTEMAAVQPENCVTVAATTLSISSIRPARRANRKVLCGTMAGTWWRSSGA